MIRRIGIDVGGTNTDAVLMVDGQVRGAVKSPTTADVTGGILAALAQLDRAVGGAAPVDAVLIGTTHFVNAVVQRRGLAPVAAIRIGLPATAALPPFTDWPPDLAAAARGGVWMVAGGHDYDGRRFAPLDVDAVRRAAAAIAARGLRQVAVCAMFSPIDPSDEETVAALVREAVPGAAVTCAHELGGIGLIERENAALLNAALAPLAADTVRGFRAALAGIGLDAPLYITQNDGTVAEAGRAAAFPVYSFASGPTNSMRGAAYLSGLQDAVVVDVGGTSADFGHLRAGFPREANGVVHIGGVRTLFRMPDLVSIGLGGGSLVDPQTLTVGPDSVGYRLPQEGLAFGGGRLTATDIAVAAGRAAIGERRRVAHLDRALVGRVLARVQATLEEHVDRIKPTAADVVLIAVGGGSFLVPDRLDGVAAVVRPEHGGCANAVGAAIAQVSGEVDQVFQDVPRAAAVARAQRLAEERALAAGAAPGTVRLVEAEDIPLAYLPGNALRVRAKVVGDIAA